MTKVLGITSPVMLNKVSIHAESPHPVSAMPKRPSPFKGEGQEGEVCHPQPVMLNEVKHPYWIPHWRSE